MSRNKTPCLLQIALSAFTLLPLLPASAALADLYSVHTVAGDNARSFAAGDDYGDYVINESAYAGPKCGNLSDPGGSKPCYLVYNAATQQSTYSFTVPTLPTDPFPAEGSGCNFSLSDYSFISSELCDNGHEIISGFSDPVTGRPQGIMGVFDGPDPLLDLIATGSLDGRAILTSSGNLFYDDGLDDNLNVALDLSASPVPEPSSLLLLGTGAISLAELVRRRRIPQTHP